MTADSKIEWCTHTFSPWLGCTPVSAACDHCYAADLARRYGWPEYKAGVPRRRTAPSTWKLPHRWQRQAAANGVRASIFPSLCDPFDGEVPIAWIDEFMGDQVEATPDLDWLLLTKRPHLARKYFDARKGGVPRNVALGVTAETQAMADLRIPQLLSIDGVGTRFVSIEPMLGPIDLAPLDWTVELLSRWYTKDAFDPTGSQPVRERASWLFPKVDWIIVGGESGALARPAHPDWIRALRDQSVAAGAAFFFKQWGEYEPVGPAGSQTASEMIADTRPDRLLMIDTMGRSVDLAASDREWLFVRAGKAAAGAELDGRHWRQFPPQLQAAA